MNPMEAHVFAAYRKGIKQRFAGIKRPNLDRYHGFLHGPFEKAKRIGGSMRAYLAGPMSGLPDCNFPAFHEAAKDLRDRGIDIVSPAEMDEERGFNGKGEPPPGWTLGKCLAYDLPAIETCDAVILLPGWEQSRGAKVERFFAETIGKEVACYQGDGRYITGTWRGGRPGGWMFPPNGKWHGEEFKPVKKLAHDEY